MGILFIIYIISSICSPRHSTHFLSRFTVFVRILLNILRSTVAQQCNSLLKVTKISDFNNIYLCVQESTECKVQC
jgi:hypothetical protein